MFLVPEIVMSFSLAYLNALASRAMIAVSMEVPFRICHTSQSVRTTIMKAT
jgi:hypothetical protein